MADNPKSAEKPVCHVRRHLTPSQFMTYDAMRAMAKDDGHGALVCYARLTTIANHTSLSRNQNRTNIARLEALGWLIQDARSRWRGGRFGSNRYEVLTHDDYERFALQRVAPYTLCPGYKFEASSGKLLTQSEGVPENFTTSSSLDLDHVQPTGPGTKSSLSNDHVQPTGHKSCISPKESKPDLEV